MNKEKQILAQAKECFADFKDFLKKEEAAEKLKVSQRTIDRMAAAGRLTKFQVHDTNAVRFSANQISVLFNKKADPPKPKPVKTTFTKYSTDKKLPPVFPPAFEKTIEVTLPDNSILLSATGCFDPTDPTGEVKKFHWEKLKGSPDMGMLRDPGKLSTEFVSLVYGDYKIKLTLTGSTGVSSSKEVTIKVKMPKMPNPSDAAKPDPSTTTQGAFKSNLGSFFFPVKNSKK